MGMKYNQNGEQKENPASESSSDSSLASGFSLKFQVITVSVKFRSRFTVVAVVMVGEFGIILPRRRNQTGAIVLSVVLPTSTVTALADRGNLLAAAPVRAPAVIPSVRISKTGISSVTGFSARTPAAVAIVIGYRTTVTSVAIPPPAAAAKQQQHQNTVHKVSPYDWFMVSYAGCSKKCKITYRQTLQYSGGE